MHREAERHMRKINNVQLLVSKERLMWLENYKFYSIWYINDLIDNINLNAYTNRYDCVKSQLAMSVRQLVNKLFNPTFNEIFLYVTSEQIK